MVWFWMALTVGLLVWASIHNGKFYDRQDDLYRKISNVN
jgi:hypothetical protein